MSPALVFIAGFALGAIVVLIVTAIRRSEMERITTRLGQTFDSLSLNALKGNSTSFLQLAHESFSRERESGSQELNSKKDAIDQTLGEMKAELGKVNELVNALEKDRIAKFGGLEAQLKATHAEVSRLGDTTDLLQRALASKDARGQWGERIAEEILTLAGFIENVDYVKQRRVEGGPARPDFTFLLPQGLQLNMDVKFSLENYQRFLKAESDEERDRFSKAFCQDVRQRIKEVTTRDYIDRSANTLDYVLVFIPNEQVYGFVNEHDRLLMDDALARRVILCAPFTLYAILAVIRQGIDNYSMEKTAAEILALLGGFERQWTEFVKGFDKMGKRLSEAQDAFQELVSTRRRLLENKLAKIEDLRRAKKIELPKDDEEPFAAGVTAANETEP